MEETRVESRRKATLTMHFSQFALPPVQDALVIGKRAPVGINAIERAFHELVPNTFKVIRVDHPVIEGVMVRQSDLRKLPENQLLQLIIRNAERIMDESDSLHVKITIEISVTEEVKLP